MATDQAAVRQAPAQAAVEATNAAVRAMLTAAGESSYGVRSKPTSTGPKLVGPTLKQPIFDCGSADKYIALKNFWLEVDTIFKTYNTNEAESTNYKKKLARQKRPTIPRKCQAGRVRNMQ